MHRWSRFGANEMDESDFRREFIPLFTFQCTIELLFFSEAIGKKPRKHNAEFSVGIKRKEATFCIAVLGKADVRRKYYHVRTQEVLFRVWKCVLSVSQLSNAVHSVKDTDWQKGRCTVTFSRGPLQHLVVTEVSRLPSLSECANFMRKIISGLTVKGNTTHCIVYCCMFPIR